MTAKRILFFILVIAIMASVVQRLAYQAFASSAAQNVTTPKIQESPKESLNTVSQQPINATRAAKEEKALQDARRQQIIDREAAVAAKEIELKKLSAKIETQLKALEESKKRLDESMKAQSEAKKKMLNDNTQKMVKLFKTMKSDQAGKMLDSLKEDMALSLLSRMDTKTVAKLAPFISQPRILKWVSDNMQER